MALIRAAQSEVVCSAFCDATLGLAIHAMFNVPHKTLSIVSNAFEWPPKVTFVDVSRLGIEITFDLIELLFLIGICCTIKPGN